MTETQLAFLRAIRASPDDDVPRLVYSDWLEENGFAEWAGLIRCQCRLVNPTAHGIPPDRYAELEFEHHSRMQSPNLPDAIPGLAHRNLVALGFDGDHLHPELTLQEPHRPDSWMHVRFRRGFIVAVIGPRPDVRARLPDLPRHHLLEEVVPEAMPG